MNDDSLRLLRDGCAVLDQQPDGRHRVRYDERGREARRPGEPPEPDGPVLRNGDTLAFDWDVAGDPYTAAAEADLREGFAKAVDRAFEREWWAAHGGRPR